MSSDPTVDFPNSAITDPFAALVEALNRIAFLERQVKQLQQMHDAKLPAGVSHMWVQPLSNQGSEE